MVKTVTNAVAMYKQMGTLVHMGTYRHILDKPSALHSPIVHMVTLGHILTHGVSKANNIDTEVAVYQTNGHMSAHEHIQTHT